MSVDYLSSCPLLQVGGYSSPPPATPPGEGGPPGRAPPRPDPTRQFVPELSCKIADLGNACWTGHHYTEDIQTRQYRALEVDSQRSEPNQIIIFCCSGAVSSWIRHPRGHLVHGLYGVRARHGGLLVRAALGGRLHARRGLFCILFSCQLHCTVLQDHLAHIIELCGPIPNRIAQSGKYSRHLFKKNGEWGGRVGGGSNHQIQTNSNQFIVFSFPIAILYSLGLHKLYVKNVLHVGCRGVATHYQAEAVAAVRSSNREI